MNKEQSTAVAVVGQPGALTVAEQDAQLAALMNEDAGKGFAKVTAADIAIPFFKLLQKGSPETEEGNAAFMPEAKPGLILNTVTRELIDVRTTQNKFALIVPVDYEKNVVEWRPNQGGIVKKHPMNQAMLDAADRVNTPDGGTKLMNADGNVLEETAYYRIILIAESGSNTWGILALSGSKLGPAKKLMSLTKSKKLPSGADAPMFGHVYKLSSFLDTSKRTRNTFQNFRFDDFGKVTIPAYMAAREYFNAVTAGTVKDADEAAAADGAPATGSNGGSDDVPF